MRSYTSKEPLLGVHQRCSRMHKDHGPCERTRSTRASKDTVKGHHKKGYVWMLKLDAFLFFFLEGICVISLDLWMIN